MDPIFLDGEIGYGPSAPAEFHTLLNAQPNPAQIKIFSGGGSAFAGLALAGLIAAHPSRVEVTIFGLAASAATLASCACDYVRIADTAVMMIHDPSAGRSGTAEDLRKAAEMLDAVRSAMVAGYRRRWKGTEDELQTLLSAETWITAEEAVRLGLADEVITAPPVKASFDLSALRLPDEVRARLTPPEAPKSAPVQAKKPPARKGAVQVNEKIKNLIVALAGALPLAQELAASDDATQAQLGKRIAEGLAPMAAEAQALIPDEDQPKASLNEALAAWQEVFATSNQATGMRGQIRALRDNANTAAGVGEKAQVKALVADAISGAVKKIYPHERAEFEAYSLADLRGYLATKRPIPGSEAMSTEAVKAKQITIENTDSAEDAQIEAVVKKASGKAG